MESMSTRTIFLCALAGIFSIALPALAASDDVTFENVTVNGASNMSTQPRITAQSTLPTAKLKWKDLVVGKGEAATASSTVSVLYVGVRYADGKQFDVSWNKASPATFRLNKVVKGFKQGIGGNDEVPAMKVGGRRLLILPAELAYGENGTPDGSIPPNASIVFVIDLLAVK
jgi:FKBP-type peptidyl-prolyl cis-trans isomerase